MNFIKLIFILSFVCVSFSSVGQPKLIPNNKENLEFLWLIENTGKTNTNISECITDWLSIFDSPKITQNSESESVRINGHYSYSYYIQDITIPIGDIEFDYEFFARNRKLFCKFYNFNHVNTEKVSDYGSVGIFPSTYNGKVKNTFSFSEYFELKTDVMANMTNLVRIVNKHCIGKK